MSKVKLSDRVLAGLENLQDNWGDFFDCVYQVEDYIWSVKRNNDNHPTDSKTLNALDKLKEIIDMIKPLEM